MNLSERQNITSLIRHEFGHLVVAKSVGFTTGDISLSREHAGAEIDLLPSFESLDDAKKFMEARVQVLFAGTLAETLHRGKVDTVAANKLLEKTANNDFAKVRELLRLLVGIQFPGSSEADFQTHLTQISEGLYRRTQKAVESYATTITDLTLLFMRELDAATSKYGRAPDPFVLPGQVIDGASVWKAGA